MTATVQVQAFASLAMVAVLFIFVAATFRAPLPKPLTSDLSGLNFYGYSSIADMPISLFSATVFSEAMWQRCWATVDKKCALPHFLAPAPALESCVIPHSTVYLQFLIRHYGSWSPPCSYIACRVDEGCCACVIMSGKHSWVENPNRHIVPYH